MSNNSPQKELLFQLHQQFSENQNDIGARFNSILIALISLFGFYGLTYSLATGLISIKDYSISKNAVFLFAIIIEAVLVFLISLLIYMGYQHRRDQAMNTKIRKHYTGSNFNHFFHNYTGENKGLLNYIPDFLWIKALFLVSLKVMLSFSLVMLPLIGKAQVSSDSSIDKSSSATSNAEININKTYHVTNQPVIKTITDTAQNSSVQNIYNQVSPCHYENKNPSSNPIYCGYFCTAIIIWVIGLIIIILLLLRYHEKCKKSNSNPFDYTKTIERDSNGKITKITINKTT